MTPHIDLQEPVRRFEQPEDRFGSVHVLRDEIPAIYPEIIDLLEHQEMAEIETISRHTLRKGEIAVNDTVSLDTGRSNRYESPTGLYL